MSSPYFQTEQDIIRTCGYIKDDQYIASVYGVSVWRVKRLREKVPQNKRAENRAYHHQGEPVDYKNSERAYHQMMEIGSRSLLEKLLKFFDERRKRMNDATKSR